jgi:hypothetical protein
MTLLVHKTMISGASVLLAELFEKMASLRRKNNFSNKVYLFSVLELFSVTVRPAYK